MMPEALIDSAFDSKIAEALAGRLLNVLNSGALCSMISVCHHTGLFDVVRELPLATSAEIATGAGFRERYVREWPAAMGAPLCKNIPVKGGFVS